MSWRCWPTRRARRGWASLSCSKCSFRRAAFLVQEIAVAVVVYLAKQVGASADQYLRYDWARPHHQVPPRPDPRLFGFREATVRDGEALVARLASHIVPTLALV
jgi:hypothetical protein